ncbi:glycosyltransferase family 9 protein [Streptomonospora litoralis]|uniref:Lipopolysaccharide core heptosyltransferase RfaQ n=1 Tax=Streptomonospora litoralis TaxID=2498135 RepID=A0A4P6Q655_9ACTN|nr:glycosyltransferase family 9 protein [Streptomonospora litoralis]QBI54509.1 Lipopolysaccharide core heptosyltransferase RfaQ [Streptomonospora litoralis]
MSAPGTGEGAPAPRGGTVLVARMDNVGDVLLAGPAVRAAAGGADRLVLLAGPRGRAAADLLPGVDRVLQWCAPWIDPEPPALTPRSAEDLIAAVRAEDPAAALILTSFHQSPLPLAALLRLAGVGWIGAACEDYPGSLLNLRHRTDHTRPEAERMLHLAEAAGYRLPPGDDGAPRIRGPLPETAHLAGGPGYVALHAGASAPARAIPRPLAEDTVAALAAQGRRVVVTGGAPEGRDTAAVAGAAARDLGGRTGLAELAGVLAGASVLVSGNTGAAHLATAVGTPVVSLFAPVVSASSWAPRGSPVRVLGDQDAPCRGTRARTCPVPGHPCLNSVTPADVLAAVDELAGGPP